MTAPLDFAASSPWPVGLRDRLDSLRQGHVITGIPAFFLGSASDPIWAQPRESATPHPLITEPNSPPRRAMILTQACDIMRDTDPWITVAPVYDAAEILDRGTRGLVSSHRVLHLVRLTAQWATGGFWVADLRLELPIEKSLLIGTEQQEAFETELEYAVLAQRLGARRSRLAAPDSCIVWVVRPVMDALQALGDLGIALLASVRELRVGWNDPNEPTEAQLYVIGQPGSAPPDPEPWELIVGQLYQPALEHGLVIVGPLFETMNSMSAADYVMSAPITDTLSS